MELVIGIVGIRKSQGPYEDHLLAAIGKSYRD